MIIPFIKVLMLNMWNSRIFCCPVTLCIILIIDRDVRNWDFLCCVKVLRSFIFVHLIFNNSSTSLSLPSFYWPWPVQYLSRYLSCPIWSQITLSIFRWFLCLFLGYSESLLTPRTSDVLCKHPASSTYVISKTYDYNPQPVCSLISWFSFKTPLGLAWFILPMLWVLFCVFSFIQCILAFGTLLVR